MPLTRYDQYADGWDTAVSINIDGESVKFFHALVKGVHRVFVDHPLFLAKVGIKRNNNINRISVMATIFVG